MLKADRHAIIMNGPGLPKALRLAGDLFNNLLQCKYRSIKGQARMRLTITCGSLPKDLLGTTARKKREYRVNVAILHLESIGAMKIEGSIHALTSCPQKGPAVFCETVEFIRKMRIEWAGKDDLVSHMICQLRTIKHEA